MFKRNEKKTARQSTVTGLVFHGAISALTRGNSNLDGFDGVIQKRNQVGLTAD